LEYINDDELVEATPDALRFRKYFLTEVERKPRLALGELTCHFFAAPPSGTKRGRTCPPPFRAQASGSAAVGPSHEHLINSSQQHRLVLVFLQVDRQGSDTAEAPKIAYQMRTQDQTRRQFNAQLQFFWSAPLHPHRLPIQMFPDEHPDILHGWQRRGSVGRKPAKLAARPTITPSTPVSATMRRASSGNRMPPLPLTGVRRGQFS
jgi:hypothetical protein